MIWGDILNNPVFLSSLFVKLILIFLFVPEIQSNWFVPFIVSWINNPMTIPWDNFLYQNKGSILSFPYGPIMFIIHLPGVFLGWLVDLNLGSNYFAGFFFRLNLLIADIFLLLFFIQNFQKFLKGILIFYWASPILFYSTYFHGQTDIIPITLLIISIVMISRQNYIISAILLALSISAKHSMILTLPFILVYLWRNRGIQDEILIYIKYFLPFLLIIIGPFLISDGFWNMVMQNKEVNNLYELTIRIGPNLYFYITPTLYILTLYFFWRMQRINIDLLWSILGVAFSIIILTTSSPPGWYLWMVPILALHQIKSGNNSIIMVSIFSFLYVFYYFIFFDLYNFKFGETELFLYNSVKMQSIIYTILNCVGILIMIQIIREGIRYNDYFQLGRRPLVIGIAGDSGVGKTTFANSLASIFGFRSSVEVSGDDYHKWDRLSSMWKSQTHLNPIANDLFKLVRNVRKLVQGYTVRARTYDHKTGRFTQEKPTKTNKVIFVTGLHVLYPKQLINQLDTSFFLEMNPDLRMDLRSRRDISERGHTRSNVIQTMKTREKDSKKFIEPQAERANVVFTILLSNPLISKNINHDYDFKIKALIRNGYYYQEIVRVLIGICGLHVNIEQLEEFGEVLLDISGELHSEDTKLAISILLPELDELLDRGATFGSGITGMMQIIALMEINEALRKRIAEW